MFNSLCCFLFYLQEETPKQTKSKIRFRLKKKFGNPAKSAASSLGLVEGNSTNTVNTVEDTEGSSNAERKAGVETAFSSDEVRMRRRIESTCLMSQYRTNLSRLLVFVELND